MCPNKDWFSTYSSLEGGVVLMGNKSPCKITGIGTIQIRMHDEIIKTLSHVKHVPNLKKNIVSLGILELNGCRIVIESNNIKVSRGSLVFMRGQKVDNLYILQRSTVTGVAVISLTIMEKELKSMPCRDKETLDVTTCYLVNQFPHRALDGKVPEEIWSGFAADVKGVKICLHRDKGFGNIATSQQNHDICEAEDVSELQKVTCGDERGDGVSSKNETWKLVKPPTRKKIVGCKWVFKKEGSGLGDTRYNARLVAKGSSQVEGLDVKATFLHGDLEEDIYMQQSEGFRIKDKEDHVCLLQKSFKCAISWKATVALSTIEAEYMAVIEAVKEAI
ncbi:Retrovirus-related Pol polyprotein from transposon TNT 1-94 [Gossypium australe]|uniref:Retrovirus-related Pol polyprotein from transposon TNT 1-94 n=1 Tax=Gossypium australe TaxID=47621 RepID=A0A5B6VNR2_9ROSI|nr:Retrovirus-related Pol polyprotein from transposon TNT 1-94 [Gossypium australe]